MFTKLSHQIEMHVSNSCVIFFKKPYLTAHRITLSSVNNNIFLIEVMTLLVWLTSLRKNQLVLMEN